MAETSNNPIHIETETNEKGDIEVARIRFGPHYLLEVRQDSKGVSFQLVATHHGFKADASTVSGELERIIEEVRGSHPRTAVD